MRNLLNPWRAFRIGLAFVCAFLTLLLMTVSAIILASIHRYILRREISKSRLILFPKWFCEIVVEISYKWLLNVHLNIFDGEPLPRGQGDLIVIANHPSTSVLIPLACAVTRLAPRFVVVIKAEHRRNLMGIALQLLDSVVFVDRTDPQSALEAIKAMPIRTDGPKTVYLIFPDGKRPTTKNLAEERRARTKRNLPDLGLHNLISPRPRGTFHLLQMVPNASLIFMRNSLDYRDEGLIDAPKLFGKTFWVDLLRIQRPAPLDEDTVRALLNHLWQDADGWTRHLYRRPTSRAA